MRSWVLALALCACGDVNKAPPDAPSKDAYQPDAPASCGVGEMLCAGACANVMTSDQHCGSCDTQCAPNEVCHAGTCLASNINCARVKELDPNAADGGAFRNPNTGVEFACDFTLRKQYEFALGQYNVAYTGYTLMSVASFDASVKPAFIGYYNLVGGLRTLASFSVGLCCITEANNLELGFGSTYLSLSQNGANVCGGPYNGVYQIMKAQTTPQTPPLPNDYFTTNPVTETAACGDNNNIGLFVKTTSY